MEQPERLDTGVVIVAAVQPSNVHAVTSRSGFEVDKCEVVRLNPLMTAGVPILITRAA